MLLEELLCTEQGDRRSPCTQSLPTSSETRPAELPSALLGLALCPMLRQVVPDAQAGLGARQTGGGGGKTHMPPHIAPGHAGAVWTHLTKPEIIR